jgi:hypothetical protein
VSQPLEIIIPLVYGPPGGWPKNTTITTINKVVTFTPAQAPTELYSWPPPSGVGGCHRTMPNAKEIWSARVEQAAHYRVSYFTCLRDLTACRRGVGAAQAAGLSVLLHGGPHRVGYVCGAAEGCGAPLCPGPLRPLGMVQA